MRYVIINLLLAARKISIEFLDHHWRQFDRAISMVGSYDNMLEVINDFHHQTTYHQPDHGDFNNSILAANFTISNSKYQNEVSLKKPADEENLLGKITDLIQYIERNNNNLTTSHKLQQIVPTSSLLLLKKPLVSNPSIKITTVSSNLESTINKNSSYHQIKDESSIPPASNNSKSMLKKPTEETTSRLIITLRPQSRISTHSKSILQVSDGQKQVDTSKLKIEETLSQLQSTDSKQLLTRSDNDKHLESNRLIKNELIKPLKFEDKIDAIFRPKRTLIVSKNNNNSSIIKNEENNKSIALVAALSKPNSESNQVKSSDSILRLPPSLPIRFSTKEQSDKVKTINDTLLLQSEESNKSKVAAANLKPITKACLVSSLSVDSKKTKAKLKLKTNVEKSRQHSVLICRSSPSKFQSTKSLKELPLDGRKTYCDSIALTIEENNRTDSVKSKIASKASLIKSSSNKSEEQKRKPNSLMLKTLSNQAQHDKSANVTNLIAKRLKSLEENHRDMCKIAFYNKRQFRRFEINLKSKNNNSYNEEIGSNNKMKKISNSSNIQNVDQLSISPPKFLADRNETKLIEMNKKAFGEFEQILRTIKLFQIKDFNNKKSTQSISSDGKTGKGKARIDDVKKKSMSTTQVNSISWTNQYSSNNTNSNRLVEIRRRLSPTVIAQRKMNIKSSTPTMDDNDGDNNKKLKHKHNLSAINEERTEAATDDSTFANNSKQRLRGTEFPPMGSRRNEKVLAIKHNYPTNNSKKLQEQQSGNIMKTSSASIKQPQTEELEHKEEDVDPHLLSQELFQNVKLTSRQLKMNNQKQFLGTKTISDKTGNIKMMSQKALKQSKSAKTKMNLRPVNKELDLKDFNKKKILSNTNSSSSESRIDDNKIEPELTSSSVTDEIFMIKTNRTVDNKSSNTVIRDVAEEELLTEDDDESLRSQKLFKNVKLNSSQLKTIDYPKRSRDLPSVKSSNKMIKIRGATQKRSFGDDKQIEVTELMNRKISSSLESSRKILTGESIELLDPVLMNTATVKEESIEDNEFIWFKPQQINVKADKQRNQKSKIPQRVIDGQKIIRLLPDEMESSSKKATADLCDVNADEEIDGEFFQVSVIKEEEDDSKQSICPSDSNNEVAR